MKKSTTVPSGSRDVSRKAIDHVLLALSLLGLLLYLLVVRLIPEIHRELEAFDVLWLGPLSLMLVSLGAAAHSLARGGATRRSRLLWAASVTLALVAWFPALFAIGFASGGVVR